MAARTPDRSTDVGCVSGSTPTLLARMPGVNHTSEMVYVIQLRYIRVFLTIVASLTFIQLLVLSYWRFSWWWDTLFHLLRVSLSKYELLLNYTLWRLIYHCLIEHAKGIRAFTLLYRELSRTTHRFASLTLIVFLLFKLLLLLYLGFGFQFLAFNSLSLFNFLNCSNFCSIVEHSFDEISMRHNMLLERPHF